MLISKLNTQEVTMATQVGHLKVSVDVLFVVCDSNLITHSDKSSIHINR